MLALHAGFKDQYLLLWGESPSERSGRGKRGVHPLDAGEEKLAEVLHAIGSTLPKKHFQLAEIFLPSTGNSPWPSSALVGEMLESESQNKAAKILPWKVTSLALRPAAAVDLLCLCVDKEILLPGVMVGTDLAFWTRALRFAGTLVARHQFLPDLAPRGEQFCACWRPVFIGADEERRRLLAASMPSAARSMAPEIPSALACLDEFLDVITDALVRGTARDETDFFRFVESRAPLAAGKLERDFETRDFETGTRILKRNLRPDSTEGDPTVLHDRWLAGLQSKDGNVIGSDAELRNLARQIEDWRRPVSVLTRAPFRLCFRLEEPSATSATSTPDAWQVRYLLQARSDPSLLIPAETIWSKSGAKLAAWNGAFEPREHLLLSLGQASGICPNIEASLKSPSPAGYELDVTGAHDFLSEKAIALEQGGFGVMLPAWWTRKGTKSRLTAGAHVKSPFLKSSGGLSLDSILDFQWEISLGGEKLTIAELRALAALKSPLVKFRGQWVQMSAGEIQTALDFWKNKSGKTTTAREIVRMALGADAPSGAMEFTGVSAEGWIGDLIQQLEGRQSFAEILPPEGLHATLRPYQLRGYSWLAFVRHWGLGACLADDMGLGKTIQTLSLILHDRHAGADRPVLLLCPTSVVGNWQKEAARFTPELPVMVHHGLGRTKGKAFVESVSRHAMVISSYALVHRDFEHLREVQWGAVILDEAQNIKNPETKQAAAARALSAGYRIALTGTPVENTVGDLWSIMEFLNPGFLGTRADFKRNFFLPIQSGRDPEAATRLKKLTGPFILRRLKTDKSIISDLPEKLEMKVFCTLTKEQASLYAAVVQESLKAIESTDGIKRKGIVLATLSRLKQVCNHPAHYLGDNSPLAGRSGKLARLTEMIEEAMSVGDRVLIFSQFSEMGEMLRRHLQDTLGREALFLHGAVPKKKRDQMVERFQEEKDGPPLFILSLKAGGTGLNLTRANHVFHFDRWWNPAVENQATDRAFRIGQQKNVQVHKFLCAGTLEEKIDEMIERKKSIAAGVVGSGEGWLTELSTHDLKELFVLRKEAVAE